MLPYDDIQLHINGGYPSPSQVVEIKHFVASQNRELELVENAIANSQKNRGMWKTRARLLRSIYNATRLLAPIRRLPTDVLRMVIEASLDEHKASLRDFYEDSLQWSPPKEDSWTMGEYYRVRTGLLLVCHRWNHILIDMHSVWSIIVLTSRITEKTITLSVERSKDHPLEIYFGKSWNISPRTLYWFNRLISPHKHRIVALQTGTRDFTKLKELFPPGVSTEFSALRQLVLSNRVSGFQAVHAPVIEAFKFEGVIKDHWPLSDESLSSLKNLELVLIGEYDAMLKLPICSFQNLVHLTIKPGGLLHPDFFHCSSFPSLVQLRLVSWGTRPDEWYMRPNEWAGNFPFRVVRQPKAPRLKLLSFDNFDIGSRIFTPSDALSVHHLCLASCRLSDDILASLRDSFPQLEDIFVFNDHITLQLTTLLLDLCSKQRITPHCFFSNATSDFLEQLPSLEKRFPGQICVDPNSRMLYEQAVSSTTTRSGL
ncbi:hypothetical protein M422DRAFT_26415 [Sphaerobolus stellatus SS14]|nr:hypothetical protein M422DRAFT_26415 [Sphaerobolus stellatus SS14]